ncbi:hypothetical protein WME90_07815 [Sorangium sp. So ce375]|uniref:hypothetical protein n=1 Tax=Sorangium sp. So ce375 TaxID=3133306 RepID=UPI003F5C9562
MTQLKRPPHPATVARPRVPHEAMIVQQRPAHPAMLPRGPAPHPAAVAPQRVSRTPSPRADSERIVQRSAAVAAPSKLDVAGQYWTQVLEETHACGEELARYTSSLAPDSPQAEGLRAWAYNHWNKCHASFLELKKAINPVLFGMGKISAELGHDTKRHPDVSLFTPHSTIAIETKNITTEKQGDVDKALNEAMAQLSKRVTAPDSKTPVTKRQAHINVTNVENPWPHTPSSAPSTKPTPIELGTTAKARTLKSGGGNVVVIVTSARWGRIEFFL